MLCGGELKFNLAEKKSDAAKYQVNEVSIIIRKTKKCKLHETLIEVIAKIMIRWQST